MTRFSHAFSCAFCTGFCPFWQGTCFNGYHFKRDVLGCCLHWHEECVRSMCFTGEDIGGRLTKSSAIERRTRNELVAYQPLVAYNVMPIREMLLMMGVIILILFRLRNMQVCSRTRANVAWHVLSLLLLVSSMHTDRHDVHQCRSELCWQIRRHARR